MRRMACSRARQIALARAGASTGTEAVRSAAMATRGELTLEVRAANVMGVNVPAFDQKRVARSALARGYSLTGTSVTIDEAAAAFEADVDSAIQLAESELRLTRLAAETQRTSRRVNALQYALIPPAPSGRAQLHSNGPRRAQARRSLSAEACQADASAAAC
nr:V-type ATP synthase subunit D [Chloroflexota bacterium]